MASPVTQTVPGIREKICFGCGDCSSNLLWGISGAFLMYYYTDTLRVSTSDVAMLLLVTRVFDAFADPAIGYAIDRSGGRLVRPLIKWLAVPFGIIAFLVFLPVSAHSQIRLAWAYVTYFIFGLIYTCINTPYGILQNIMTPDAQARVSLGSFRMIGCQLGTLTVYLLTLPAVHWLGGGTSSQHELIGFPIYMAIVGAAGAALWFVTYRGCKVRHFAESQRHSVKTLLRSLLSNRPWVVCTAAFGLSFIILASFLSFAIYYARVVLEKDAAYGGLLLTLFTVCGLAGNVSVSMPWMAWLGGPKRRLQVSYAVLAVSLTIIGLSPASPSVFLPCYIVACFAFGFGSPLYYAMLADSIDYGSRITGVRSAGMGYSLNSLAQKALFGLTSALLAQFLSFGGYVPDAPQQNAGLAAWLTAGFIWLPACVSLLLIGIVALYPSGAYGVAAGDGDRNQFVHQGGD